MLSTIKFGILSLFVATTLLLLIPLSFLWLRSYFLTDDLHYYTAGRFTRFRTSGGGFWFETRPWNPAEPSRLDWQQFTERADYPFAADKSSPVWQRCGFLVSTKDYDLLMVAPYWSVVGPLLLDIFGSVIAVSRRKKVNEE